MIIIVSIIFIILLIICLKYFIRYETKTVSIQLSEEEMSNLSKASFIIFDTDVDHVGYYREIFRSNDVTIHDRFLIGNIGKRLLKIKNTSTNKYDYVPCQYNINSIDKRIIDASLIEDGRDYFLTKSTFIISNGDKPVIKEAILEDEAERLSRSELLKSIYSKYIIRINSYILSTNDFNDKSILDSRVGTLRDLHFINSGLDKGERYFVIFVIEDQDGNIHYSRRIDLIG